MKLVESSVNPLNYIIALFGDTSETISKLEFSRVKEYLAIGGVICENNEEVERCLCLLHDLEVLEVSKQTNGTILVRKGHNVIET